MSYLDLFLKVLVDHEESDVVIFCKARHQISPVRSSEVEFFCHKDVLKRCCSVFADADEFDTLSGANRDGAALQGRPRRRFELWAEDDVVFEVLRYIYCGAIFFPMGFRARFAHFLAVVDFLGIEDMAERIDDLIELGPNFVGRALPRTSIFAEVGLQQWLQDLQREDLVLFLQDDLVASTLDHGVGAVGFSLLCSLITQLLHLRPQDLTMEALGERLYGRLANFGCHQTQDERGIYCNEGRALHLPAPVIYVDLGSNCIRSVNVPGKESVSKAQPFGPEAEANRRLQVKSSLLRLCTAVSTGAEPTPSTSSSSGAAAGTSQSSTARSAGRLFHRGSPIPDDASLDLFQKDCQPHHHHPLVVFRESAEGQHLFDTSLQRERRSSVHNTSSLAAVLDRLVNEAHRRHLANARNTSEESRTGGDLPHQVLEVRFPSHHALLNELDLIRDVDENNEPVLKVLAVKEAGGRSSRTGLRRGCKIYSVLPDDLVLDALTAAMVPFHRQGPGQRIFTTATWTSLRELSITAQPPSDSVSLHFEDRPFGFSWYQEDDDIVISGLKEGGFANASQQVKSGMRLQSISYARLQDPIISKVGMIQALRDTEKPATLTFGWRPTKKTFQAEALLGLKFEERTTREGKAVVVISEAPSHHPLFGYEYVNNAWELLAVEASSGKLIKTITSLSDLPARFLQHEVTLRFVEPPDLFETVPLDRYCGSNGSSTLEEWHRSSTQILQNLPWAEFEHTQLGELHCFHLRSRSTQRSSAENNSMDDIVSVFQAADALDSESEVEPSRSDASASSISGRPYSSASHQSHFNDYLLRGHIQQMFQNRNENSTTRATYRQRILDMFRNNINPQSQEQLLPLNRRPSHSIYLSPKPEHFLEIAFCAAATNSSSDSKTPVQETAVKGSGMHIQAVLLGQLPVLSAWSEELLRVASQTSLLAAEIREAFEAIGSVSPSGSSWRRTAVVAVRICPDGSGNSPIWESSEDSTWLGALILGESITQILFRLSLLAGQGFPVEG